MRWEELFADLEGQWDAAAADDLAAEVADRTRRETSLLRLVDRLRAGVGDAVELRLRTGARERGQLRAVGSDWLLVDAGGGELLVPLAALVAVRGLSRRSAPPGSEGAVAARLDLRHALRGLARDRAVLALLVDGADDAGGGVVLRGRAERVGSDYLELHDREDGLTIVPLSALVSVRSRTG